MKTVNFKFDVDQRVTTSLGETGFITSLSHNESRNNYYVQFKEGKGSWIPEAQLKAAE
ncbi:MAG: hypothetical protein OEV28_11830 [Nitrospirota bacterium]|nr:hypothetical protein [Nitrospirota bacterium]